MEDGGIGLIDLSRDKSGGELEGEEKEVEEARGKMNRREGARKKRK